MDFGILNVGGKDMERFDERIYKLREKYGYTQEDLAEKLSVSRQTISNWETGAATPTIEKVIELSDIYGMSLDELVGKEGTKVNKVSPIWLRQVNQVGTLYVDMSKEQWVFESEIKNCKIIEVNVASIRVEVEKKKQKMERQIFLKDVLFFERECN